MGFFHSWLFDTPLDTPKEKRVLPSKQRKLSCSICFFLFEMTRKQGRQEICQLSSDQNHGYLLYIGDDILPSYIGIKISHEMTGSRHQPIRMTHEMSAKAFERC